ncbi:MAG TPA: hypothetical protein VE978_14360 [Chitinophagales bacterium]|nr:hypothetical protein [Chitinophagales bacterium]
MQRGRESPFVFSQQARNIIAPVFMRICFFTCVFVLCTQFSSAEKKFEFNITCQRAYFAMMSMHFQEGDSLLAIEEALHPDNLIPYFIADIQDFFTLSFNEDPAEIKQREPNKQLRIDRMQSGPKYSPYYLYTQAEILVHWSFIHIANEQNTTGFFELRKAYHLLEENQKKFPDFIANKKFLGLIHSVVGTIPDSYKWAATFLGLKGTVPQGIAELKEVMDYAQSHSFLFADEARYVYLFMKLWMDNDPKAAWQLTEDPQYPSLKNNPLSIYVKAFLAAKIENNDLAIQIYSSTNSGSDAFVPWFMYYMFGVSKLRRLDADANVQLEKFVQNFKGTNYLKDAYREIAWAYLLKGDEAKYHYFMAFCKQKGRLFTDADKDALDELNSGIPPNVLLLKARLLTDGAYFDRALQLLEGKTTDDFSSEKDKLEFTYRLGRIYDESDAPDKAIPYYKATLDRGASLSYYFAENASLQLAQIYEAGKDFEQARYYYSKCLSMKDNVYKTSIDQKAKAGLNRINNLQKK